MDFSWGWSTAIPPTAAPSIAWCKVKTGESSVWADAPNDWVLAQTCSPADSADSVGMYLLRGIAWQNMDPESGGSLRILKCTCIPESRYEQVRQTFDHMLILGAWDLHLNYPELVSSGPADV
jgi:hypothetical protein